MEAQDSIIKINNMSLWYEKGKPIEVKALKNINIDIARGDYVAFFGPSGCGKTTMLYAITGIDHFQEGTITVNNKDISSLVNRELAVFRQTGIGIVFQQFNLIPSLTVLKNVALPMLFIGVSSKKADAEALKLLERLNLSEYGHRYPYELSGGQQQRVGIARALANDPPIIFADEPLGNLDSVNAKKVLEFLKELNEKDGRTIIMVTHEAWSLHDVKTIYHMKDGAITGVEHSTPQTLGGSLAREMSEQAASMGEGDEVAGGALTNGTTSDTLNMTVSHQLANMLLNGYSLDEIKRFELFAKDRLKEKIDAKEFGKLLSKPFKDGGLGLRIKKAQKISNYVELVISKREGMHDLYVQLSKNPEIDISKEIASIRNWIVDSYPKDFNFYELQAMDQIISDRIRNYITKEKVAELLDLKKNELGAGLSFRAAQMCADKLELIMDNSTA